MLRSRVALAIAGMLLIGGVSATAAVMSAPHARLAAQGSTQTLNNATTTGLSGSSATATDTTTESNDPTATGSGVPSATPADTATPQVPSVHGVILSINATAHTFQVSQRTGAPVTIVVNSATQYQGTASSFGALTTNMLVSVTGQTKSNGSFLAAVVNTTIDT